MATVQNAQELYDIASESKINEDAPVQVRSEISIKASPDKTWRLITVIENWKAYHPVISRSYLEDSFLVGQDFYWKARRFTSMRGKLAVIKALNEFTFSSTSLFMGFIKTGYLIMHWDMEYISDHESKITVKMSVEGFLSKMMSNQKSKLFIDQWLNALKKASESA